MSELDQLLGGSEQATIDATTGQPAAAPAAAGATTPADSQNTPPSNPATADQGKPTAPAAGQATGQPGSQAKPAGAAPAASGQAAPEISDEQILAAAGLTETPEIKLSRLERDHAASSKEARRLLEDNKKLAEMLQEQGLEIARDENGKPAGLTAGKKYSKEAAALELKFKDLPADIQAKLEDEPQKVVDYVLDRARKAFVRAMPTMDKQVAPISQERHETAVGYLSDMKWETGDPKFPGLAANRKLIEQQLNAPNVSKALKEFYHREPELALALLNLQLDHARNHVAEQAKKAAAATAAKKKDADATLQPQPSGGGGVTLGDGSDGDLGDMVARAKLQY